MFNVYRWEIYTRRNMYNSPAYHLWTYDAYHLWTNDQVTPAQRRRMIKKMLKNNDTSVSIWIGTVQPRSKRRAEAFGGVRRFHVPKRMGTVQPRSKRKRRTEA